MVGDAARIQLVVHSARHAVTADDHLVPGGHIGDGIRHKGTLFLHILHSLRVMDQRAEGGHLAAFVQQAIGQVHRPLDTKAEPRRFGNSDLHLLRSHLFPRIQQGLLVGTQLFGVAAALHGKLLCRHRLAVDHPHFAEQVHFSIRRIVQDAAGHYVHPGPRRNDEQSALGRQKLPVLFAGAPGR